MLIKIINTDNSITPLILRVVLGTVIFAHGAQKMFGIWGGHGASWTVEAWQQWWNVPEFLTYSVIFVESFGALLLILGLFTRIWAVLLSIIMLVAVYLVHLKWGFYMNWYSLPQTGEGFEYHLLVMAILCTLILKGSGKWSLDLLFKQNL